MYELMLHTSSPSMSAGSATGQPSHTTCRSGWARNKGRQVAVQQEGFSWIPRRGRANHSSNSHPSRRRQLTQTCSFCARLTQALLPRACPLTMSTPPMVVYCSAGGGEGNGGS